MNWFYSIFNTAVQVFSAREVMRDGAADDDEFHRPSLYDIYRLSRYYLG